MGVSCPVGGVGAPMPMPSPTAQIVTTSPAVAGELDDMSVPSGCVTHGEDPVPQVVRTWMLSWEVVTLKVWLATPFCEIVNVVKGGMVYGSTTNSKGI